MPNSELVASWIHAYIRAWNSNDPADITALFTEDAEYRTEPYAAPWRGSTVIVEQWLANKDEPGEAEFSWEPLAVTAHVAIIQGHTTYRTPQRTYSNLWVIKFEGDGRCREFTEWWMQHP